MTDGAALALGVPPRTTAPRRPGGRRVVVPPRSARSARHARRRGTAAWRRSAAARLARPLLVAWTGYVPVLALLVGGYARVRQWAGGRTLWLDEVLIADNLVHRGPVELVREPLAHSQAAPAIWLELERLSVLLFGTGERSLRLVPLLAGLGLLGLSLPLCRRLLPRVLVPVPMLALALHPALIYYSNEVKPYSLDALVVVALVLLAVRVRPGAGDGPPLRRLALAGAVGVWASYGAVFALAGISVVLVLRPLRDGDRRRALRIAAVLAVWLVSLLAAYLLVLRRLTQNQPLADYWAFSYPRSATDLPAWFVRRWYDLAQTPLQLTGRVLALALLGAGLVRLARHTPRRAALLWAGVPMAALGGALSAYPFAGRLVLWLVPVALVTVTAVLPDRYRPGRGPWLLAASAALTVVLAPAAVTGLGLTTRTQYVEELRPLLLRLAQQRQPGDLVLVEVATRDPFEYYAGRTGVSRDGVILFLSREEQLNCSDVAALSAGRFATDRVWVVSSHRLVDTDRLGTVDDMLGRIRTVSREVAHLREPGADAWLFDPSTGPQNPAQRGERNDDRCLTVIRSAR